jgi:hypothetical protein
VMEDLKTPTLLIHVRVYALADKYDICGLKKLAQQKFSSLVATEWDSPNFADAIVEVYDTTLDSDRGLRDLILQQIRVRPMLAKWTSIIEVMQEMPSFADDLVVIGLADRPPPALPPTPLLRIGPVNGELDEILHVDTKIPGSTMDPGWIEDEYLDWFYSA